jgi:hypothetical protein
MIERRDMLKVLVVGVVGAAVVGGIIPASRAGRGETNEVNEVMRFSVHGEMGSVRAMSALETIHVSGQFAEPAVFTLH